MLCHRSHDATVSLAQVVVGTGLPLKIERSEPHASVTFIGQVHGDTHHVLLAVPTVPNHRRHASCLVGFHLRRCMRPTLHTQVLFSAFDAVLTRAGGGTVNDALAHRVPLLLVEEKHMWQALPLRPPARAERGSSWLQLVFSAQTLETALLPLGACRKGTMRQVNEIQRDCLARGFCEGTSLAAFQADPRR